MTSILQKLSYNWCVGYNVYFELSTEAIRLIFSTRQTIVLKVCAMLLIKSVENYVKKD